MRILLCWLFATLAALSVRAEEKIPLNLPLDLSPGISHDSTAIVMLSKGASSVSNREGIYAIDYSYAGIPIRTAIPVFLKSGLFSVLLYSNPVENKEDHIARIHKVFDFINETFECLVIEEGITEGKMPADFNNGIELASFTSGDFSLALDSEYKAGEGYLLSIHVCSLPIMIPPEIK